ncbi:MAG: AraC family transcriptional regulator [Butyricicoccus sp.]
MQPSAKPAPNSWVHKKYMADRDFEIEHATDTHYHDIEPEYHEFYEIFFFVNGHIDFVVEDQLFEMRPGDLLVIPPSTLHNPIFHDFDVPYERFVLWVSAQYMERLYALDPELAGFRRTGGQPMYLMRGGADASWTSLRGSFMTLYNSAEQRDLCWRSSCMAALLRVMSAFNQAARAQAGQAPVGARSNLLTGILHYVSDNLCGDLSLETVAQVFYTNKFSISHLFQQEMRISYYQYVIQIRLLAAKKLLLEGMPPSKVWEACGFGDYVGFYRAFRKWYGVSPSQFRKLHDSLIAPAE